MSNFWAEYGKEFVFGALFTVGIVFAVAIVERVFGMKQTSQKKHRQ